MYVCMLLKICFLTLFMGVELTQPYVLTLHPIYCLMDRSCPIDYKKVWPRICKKRGILLQISWLLFSTWREYFNPHPSILLWGFAHNCYNEIKLLLQLRICQQVSQLVIGQLLSISIFIGENFLKETSS